MKSSKKTIPAILVSLLFAQCSAQAPHETISEVKAALEKGTHVSAILSNPAYLSLHPETAFRELIREHADSFALKITTAAEPGKKIRVLVDVVDPDGLPVPGVEVYLYQTDYRGWYTAQDPHVGGSSGDFEQARLFGYVYTNAAGRMELHTSKPSGYPQSNLPAHIHILFTAQGFEALQTELLFDDDDRLVGNIRRQAERSDYLISRPDNNTPDGFDQQFSYRVVLRRK
jgi:protocatechuate 3,4-dioxygenase beta subunit